jgi:hypothetical protein
MEKRDNDRAARIRRVFHRNAAYYDDPCFVLFLWIPLPNGEWQILFGSGDPADMHFFLWIERGIKALAHAWGVDPKDLWAEAGEGAIPTGYVEFEEKQGEDIPFLILPNPLPDGWSVGKIKMAIREFLEEKNSPRNVMCIYDEFRKVVPVARRGAKPDAVNKLIGILKDLQVYRSVPSESMID